MSDIFVPPQIPVADNETAPSCPRRLLNDRLYLERADDAPEAPMTASKKIRLRFQQNRPSILVNDAGMVREPGISGQPF